LKAQYPKIEILDERMAWRALHIVERGGEHADGPSRSSGIFCSNESGSIGAAQALRGRNKKMILVGFDSSPSLLDAMQAGWIDSLVIQDHSKWGRPQC